MQTIRLITQMLDAMLYLYDTHNIIHRDIKPENILVFKEPLVCRGIEEGTTYYQYPTMGIETMEETVMPIASLKVCNLIEGEGFTALPQRRHYTIVAGKDDTSPEMQHTAVFRGREKEVQMNFEKSAVLCGLGEIGFHGAVMTDEFGPLQRIAFIFNS